MALLDHQLISSHAPAARFVASAHSESPVPGIAAVCAASPDELRLNVVALGLIAGLASTIGELTGYFAGYTGQTLVQKNRYYNRIRNLMINQGSVALFTLSVIPNPIFDVAGIAAGSLGYPLRKFLLWVLLGKIIKFIDHCEEMPVAYGVANLVCSCSYEPEAFGRVSVEAQSMQVPIIASDIGGSRETVIKDKTGYLFKNKDPKALADLIVMIMQKDYNSLKSIGFEGRKNVLKRFDVDKMCQTTFTEYKKLIELS